MNRRSRSEKSEASIMNIVEKIDKHRLTKVRVLLRKTSHVKLKPGGTLKLRKVPFVKLEKVHVSSHLLAELREEYSVETTALAKVKVKVVDDDEIVLLKEAYSELGKKTIKLAVRLVEDSQTVLIQEISRYDCVFQHKNPDVKEIICADQNRSPQKITVTTVCDADSRSIRDVLKTQSVKKPIRRLNLAVRYLKPSQSEDNYGLGGKTEIDRDDVDRPIKQIPVWAEKRNYLKKMSSQAAVDSDMIFGVCEPPDMREIFQNFNKSNKNI